MKGKRILAASIITCLLCGGTAFANSAQTHFRGISSTGALLTGEQSPIVVEGERLIFDLQEFPKENYNTLPEYLAYSGKVTAEYTFHNPADYDVTATLAFPFGREPDYGQIYDGEKEAYVLAADAEKYDVMLDGVPVEKSVHHTFSYRGEDFELEKDLSRLREGDLIDDFWKPDLPVTKYSWKVDGIDEEKFPATRLGFRWKGDGRERKLLFADHCGGESAEDHTAVMTWVENGKTIELYVFGEPLTGELDWFTENGSKSTPFDYTLTPLSTETTTYKDFVFADYKEDSGVGPSDWYNAKTEYLKTCEWERGIISGFEYSDMDISRNLMRWYVYDITVPAGETVVNTVTAPMYPDMDTSYDPPIYAYTYLLSPAQSWADFGSLDIVINTPYFLTESGDLSFEQTENGYTCSLDGLPEGELAFTLSTDEHPKGNYWWRRKTSFKMAGIVFIGLFLGSIFMDARAANKRK